MKTMKKFIIAAALLLAGFATASAQKPIDLAITDARSNLLDSLRFASHDRAHGISIVLVTWQMSFYHTQF